MKLPRPPAALVRLGRRLPPPVLSLHFAAGLALAHRLGWLRPPAELDGRRFAIELTGLGLRIPFRCRGGAFRPDWGGGAADLELGAEAADFLGLLRGETDADTLFFQRRLRIGGDTELGLIVKNWLDAAERPAWLMP
ncbi:ubiquinone anaerobic biosynthesis accessory factor UbiT [Chitinimonas koreensis]|uniref:ubiquinone anaerobic biosynthesis accessory factor UbiT n=1 Tax=Chitinimonas koreensis TaxID=356302 RepID=UPI00040B1A53|nr:SCP2 sterol-binding domain-containing protein [Chitinimonas koreensis]QNM95139.1 SCP2 sterol-binding domain-containing protein [Chitinimonas koreensis]